jgi:hypothetical protein
MVTTTPTDFQSCLPGTLVPLRSNISQDILAFKYYFLERFQELSRYEFFQSSLNDYPAYEKDVV